MRPAAVPAAYGRLSVTMHWLMLALIALAYLCIELRVLFERGTPLREFLRHAHFSIGLTVMGLVLVRLWGRWRGGTPPIVPAPPPAQRLAAHAVHLLLYAFMVGMPLVGWVMLSLRGDPVPFFGIELPPLAAENKDLGKWLRGWHGDVGRIAYGVIALHAGAALFHHYRLRDNTLRRMLPVR